jgi:phenylacetate-CoA ligase
MANILCKLRAAIFWGLDFLTGGIIKKSYRNLRIFDSISSDSKQLIDYQQAKLKELLNHAKNTTKFYKNINGESLKDFPVVDKSIIIKHQEEFLSNKYEKNKLFKMSTSGSTGTPFICFQDRLKKKCVKAEVIYYTEKAGYSVGENLIFLRAVTKQNNKSKLLQLIQNEQLLNIGNLDNRSIENLLIMIKIISRLKSTMLAYGSTLDALSDYFRIKKIEFINSKIVGIISGADMLFGNTREVISKVFGCRCLSRYSNQENGIIGQDDFENNVFIINEAHYIVEIFKLNIDEPQPFGKIGRIVITDLYNKAMPMIRYDTGDIGAIGYIKISGIKKKVIKNFDGRCLDIVFDCYGNRLSPHIISNNLWSFTEILQYQFIQINKKHYLLKIKIGNEFKRKDKLKDLLLELLGAEAKIDIEIVEEIPLLKSGKRKYIVNKMN